MENEQSKKEKDFNTIESMDRARACFWNSCYGTNQYIVTKEDAILYTKQREEARLLESTNKKKSALTLPKTDF